MKAKENFKKCSAILILLVSIPQPIRLSKITANSNKNPDVDPPTA